MPDSTENHPATSVAGGTSATPTPANNVDGGAGWGDNGSHDPEEPRQGFGHVAPANARETMGKALGLQEQKHHAKDNFLQRADDSDINGHPNLHGEPTCANEDHSFMTQKPGGSETWPGWETMKNIVGVKGGPGPAS